METTSLSFSVKPSRREQMSYAIFFLGQNLMFSLQLQFMAYYYTEYLAIPVTYSATVLLISRFVTIDLFAGLFVDKANFKRGKFIPWLSVVSFGGPVSFLLMFLPINGSVTAKMVFATATYILFSFIYAVGDAPAFSLPMAMTNDPLERDKLIAYGRACAALSFLFVAPFMYIKNQLGWLSTVAVYMVISMLTMLPVNFVVKERRALPKKDSESIGVLIKAVLHNKYLFIYFGAFFIMRCTLTLQTMIAYFAKFNLQNEQLTGILIFFIMLSGPIISPFLPSLINRMGKKRLAIYASLAGITCSLAQYAIGYRSLPLFIFLAMLQMTMLQVPIKLYGTFTADCVEYGAYKTKIRTEGISFAVQNTVLKWSSGLCGAICLWLMNAGGYVEQLSRQSERTLSAIWSIMTLVPVAGYGVFCVILALFYRLSEKDVYQMLHAAGEA